LARACPLTALWFRLPLMGWWIIVKSRFLNEEIIQLIFELFIILSIRKNCLFYMEDFAQIVVILNTNIYCTIISNLLLPSFNTFNCLLCTLVNHMKDEWTHLLLFAPKMH
jgi:hypothetical protein